LERLFEEAARAVRDAAVAAGSFGEQVARKADDVARDPPASVKRLLRRSSRELEKARKEIDRILRNLE
jgi:hypothetical protein